VSKPFLDSTAISRKLQFKDSAHTRLSQTLRATKVFLRAFLEEGDRWCRITAIRYYADGIIAGGQEKHFQLSTPNG
jgi:hypothetical protein